MNFKLIRYAITGFLLLLAGLMNAQEDTYFAEIGVHGGSSYYLGDANNVLFKNAQLSYGLIYRQKFNPRLAAHLSWNSATVAGKGSIDNVNNISFNNRVNAFDLAGEFNFFSYERKEYLPFSKTFTPFIFAGVGGALGDSVATMSLPFGVGFKMMLGDRLNLNIMWSNRLMFNDNLEGKADFNDHAGLNGTNIFNNDMLSTLSVGITLNIWKKKCDCSSQSF
ncbi:MAG: hypothetical protein KA303_01025 [Paludibacter sp.]|nr:hypothetical protein [Paludibacter sp.]